MHSDNETGLTATPRHAAGATSLWKSKRLYILLSLFALTVINFASRVNMFVVAQPVAEHFGWDNATMGIVMSSFLWSYVLCVVPMGWLVDRFGVRSVLSRAIGLWGAAAILTGFAGGFFSMLAARLAFGAGASSTWPSCGKIVSAWFPAGERGIATSFYQSGASFGPAVAMPAVAWLVIAVGWQMSFAVIGAIGFVWLLAWRKMYRSPEDCAWLPEDEKAYILATRATPDQVQTAEAPRRERNAFVRVLGQKSMWGLAVSHGTMSYTQYLTLAWLPSYLMQVKHMDITGASCFSAGAFLFATVFALIAGRINDAGMSSERLAGGGRKNTVILFLLLSTEISFVTRVDSLFLIFLCVGLSFAFTTAALSLNLALTTDLIRDSGITGTAIGVQVLGGCLFGLVAPMITGFLTQLTGDFDSAFYLAGVLLCLGAFASYALVNKPIE